MDVSTGSNASSWPTEILFNAGELDHRNFQHCDFINMLLFPPELLHFTMVSSVITQTLISTTFTLVDSQKCGCSVGKKACFIEQRASASLVTIFSNFL